MTREARAPRRSRLALKGEERMGDERGQPSSQQPTDSAHDITQYRLERRDIVGIISLSLPNPYPRQSASRWPDADCADAPTSFDCIRTLPRPRLAHQTHPSHHRQTSYDFDEVED